MQSKPKRALAGVLTIIGVIALYTAWGRVSSIPMYSWHEREAAVRESDGWILIEWSNTLRDLAGPWSWFDPPITSMHFAGPVRISSPLEPGLVGVNILFTQIFYDGPQSTTAWIYLFDKQTDRYAMIDARSDTAKGMAESPTWDWKSIKWEPMGDSKYRKMLREMALSGKPMSSFAVTFGPERRR